MRYSVRNVLWIGFGLVTGLFLIASVVTVRSVNHILAIEKDLTRIDHAKHHGHLTLADIQEQYIHQAHTIILGNRSHLGHYDKAHQAAGTRLSQLEIACASIGNTNGLAEIMATLQKMDGYFRNTVIQNIETSDAEARHDFHNELEKMANLSREQILDLNTTLDQKSISARQNHEKFLAHMRKVTVGSLCAGLILAVLVAAAITRMVGTPISRIHEGFRMFGAGDMNARVSSTGPRELNELANGFNMMADDLVQAHKEMADKERMVAMGEIAAGVAHELNNPLGVITGYLKLLRKNVSGEQVNEDLAVITDEVGNCKAIVQGLLDLARPSKLRKCDLELATLIEEVLERLSTSYPESGTEVDIGGKELEIIAAVDEAAFKQVLNNLIRNAKEAAGNDGKVHIELKRMTNIARVAISDSGPGIAEDFESELFRPFKTTKENGTGLGLAISLAIVKNHGGDIEVDRGPLGGARFTVTVPTGAVGARNGDV